MKKQLWWLSLVGLGFTAIIARRHVGLFDQPKAENPAQLNRHDWKAVITETKQALKNKQLPLLSAGIAYFSTLAFFPLMAAAVAAAGLILSSAQIQTTIQAFGGYLPHDIANLLSTQLQMVSGKPATNILIGTIAFLLSLFSVSGAVQNSIKATNITYNVNENRSFLKLRLTSLLLTLGLLVLIFTILPVLMVSAHFLHQVGVPNILAYAVPYLRWVILVVLVSIGLAIFYRYGPSRINPQWQWVSWGATIATLIWLIGTALFFIYAQNFAHFSQSFGLFAGIIVLMTWFNLSAFIVLLGAEINHRLEMKTVANTEVSSND